LNCHIVQLLFILASWHTLLLNCVPMIGVSAAIWGAARADLAHLVCAFIQFIYLWHVQFFFSWSTHSVPGTSHIIIIDSCKMVWGLQVGFPMCKCDCQFDIDVKMECGSKLQLPFLIPLIWTKITQQIAWTKLFACKAEEAARDSRRNKQDRYEEMRRRKDEEREAQERQLVRDSIAASTFCSYLLSCFELWN
jgi:hypothetical protein